MGCLGLAHGIGHYGGDPIGLDIKQTWLETDCIVCTMYTLVEDPWLFFAWEVLNTGPAKLSTFNVLPNQRSNPYIPFRRMICASQMR